MLFTLLAELLGCAMTLGPSPVSATVRSVHAVVRVSYGLASIRRGELLESSFDDAREQLEGLAATLPDLFGTVDLACLDRICQRLVGEACGETFGEILVLSESSLHVIQPLSRRTGVALLAVSSAVGSIGLVLSEVRAQVAGLEAG